MSTKKNGRVVRDEHRQALVLHFFGMIAGLVALGVANRMLTPEHLWIQWALLAWAIVFVAHLLRFEKGTMATMGKDTRGSSPAEPS